MRKLLLAFADDFDRGSLAAMRLVDLDPSFIGSGGEGVSLADGSPAPERHGVGLSLICPCGCESALFIPFLNPIDAGPVLEPKGWRRTGETFETLTLKPSIQRADPKGCKWHGFITDGQIITC